MQCDLADLEHALTLFHRDGRGDFISTAFFDLEFDKGLEGPRSTASFRGVTHDLWNISALAQRLEWMRTLAVDGSLDHGSWRTYSGIDIENVFVQFRSIMDYVTEILALGLPKGGQLPDSFRRLRESRQKYLKRLPATVMELIESADWFDEMRTVRDGLVHHGARPTVFGEPREGLLFQVHGRQLSASIQHEPSMHNEHIAHFDRYISIKFARLLTFLDRLGTALKASDRPVVRVGPVRSYSTGFQLLQEWMQASRAKLHSSVANAGA